MTNTSIGKNKTVMTNTTNMTKKMKIAQNDDDDKHVTLGRFLFHKV